MLTSVSVIGLGKLGAPLAACFAARGFNVHAVDINPQKVDSINRSVPPVHEPGLAELLRESGGRISATRDIEPAVRASDATFVVVATLKIRSRYNPNSPERRGRYHSGQGACLLSD